MFLSRRLKDEYYLSEPSELVLKENISPLVFHEGGKKIYSRRRVGWGLSNLHTYSGPVSNC